MSIEGLTLGRRETWRVDDPAPDSRSPVTTDPRYGTRHDFKTSAGSRLRLRVSRQKAWIPDLPFAEHIQESPGARLAMGEVLKANPRLSDLDIYRYVVARRPMLAQAATVEERANAVRLLFLYGTCADASLVCESEKWVAFIAVAAPRKPRKDELPDAVVSAATIDLFDRADGSFYGRVTLSLETKLEDLSRENETPLEMAKVVLSGL